MTGKDQTFTPQEFSQCLAGLRESFNSTTEVRQGVVSVCGGEDVLEAMLSPQGLGIGRFAALMDLPVSTVRHFIREDLLHPWTVNGKFKFMLHNVIELRGIRQWQSLGLTLEETRAFLEGQQVAGMLVQDDSGGMATVTAGTEKCRHSRPPPSPVSARPMPDWPRSTRRWDGSWRWRGSWSNRWPSLSWPTRDGLPCALRPHGEELQSHWTAMSVPITRR